jgi:ABC-type multidrug transport system fused ATPase/permease subunit
VDKDTEELMHRLIREEFKGFTIIAVAHHLETLMDFDRIVVLDAGILVECGSPAELLSKPS